MQRRARVAGAVVIAAIGALLSAQSASRRRATNPFPPAAIRAVDDAYVAQRAQAISVSAANGVLANDFGPKKLIAILTTPPQHGFLTFLPDGSFTYTNDGTDAASDSFAYKISDGTDASLPATVTLTVTSAAPPVAQGDGYSVANNGTLQVAAPGLLANDSDPSGLALTAIVVANPAHGLLTLGANGAFTYKHDGTSSTLDLFTYRVSNGTQLSSPATVTLSIGSNVPPNVSSHSYSGTQDTPLVVSAPGVLAGATDSDSAQLTAIAGAVPAHGTLVLAKDGSFTYTPAAGYSGTDSFTYQASDGVATSTNTGVATITILSPASANGDAYTAAMNLPRAVPAPGVLANDPSGSTILSYGAATGREQTVMGALTPTVQNGTVALQSDGGFSYSPPAGFFGVDTFRYIVGNSVSSTAALVVITVSAPPIAGNDRFFAARNTARTVPAPGVLNNDTLNDGTIARASGPSHGTLTLNSDGSFLYVPTSGYVGDDAFVYSLSNATGTVQATVDLRVVAPPIAVADAFLNRTSVAAPGVFAGDTRNDATIVSYGKAGGEQTTIGQATATDHGTVTVQADGSFVYAPAAGYIGADTFAYVLSNFAGQSTATVTMTTQPAPVLQNDSYDAARNTARTVAAADGVLKNDITNGLGITAFTATSTNGGTVALNVADGSFTYTPATAFVGSDTFTYTVGSGTLATTATVTMKVVAPPVALSDAFVNQTVVPAPGVFSNDTRNGATLLSYGKTGSEQTTIGQSTATNHGTVTVQTDGSFVYAPASGFLGDDTFVYILSNFAGQATATVTVTTQSAPVLQNDSYDAARNTTRTVAAADGVLKNDTTNGLGITGSTAAGNGTVTLNSADGSFTYTPSTSFAGTDSFTYTVGSNTFARTATVTITVYAPPVAADDAYGTPPTVTLTNATSVLANDLNGGKILSYGKTTGTEQTTVGQPTPTNVDGAFVSISADGTFTYSPASSNLTTDTFRYIVSNYAGGSTAKVTITIANAPDAKDDSFFARNDASTSVALAPNDTLNGASASLPSPTTTHGGSVTITTAGVCTYTPPSGFEATDTFAYTLTNLSGSDTATVTVSVVKPPKARNDEFSVALDGGDAGNLLDNDDHSGTTTINPLAIFNPAYSVTIAPNGVVHYSKVGSPNAGFDFSFPYTLSNPDLGLSSTATVTIHVLTPP